MTVFAKTFSNRRAKEDRLPALFWVSVYALLALVAFVILLLADFGQLTWLLLPGSSVFIWHLYLVSRRAERGQRGIEIVGAGVLALAAPASYWVAEGTSVALAWALWGISWLQSAALQSSWYTNAFLNGDLKLAGLSLNAFGDPPAALPTIVSI